MLNCWRHHRMAREWLIGLCSLSLLIAPFGCEFQSLVLDTGDDVPAGPTSRGFFVNNDDASPLLAGARGPSGDAFFVYGTRDSAGGIREIQAIHVRTAAGAESYVLFELGWPVYARGGDGSYVTLAYEQVGSVLSVDVGVHPVGGAVESYRVDIDPQRTAAQVADWVEQVTGIDAAAANVPDPSTAKTSGRALGFWATAGLIALFAIPVALALNTMVVMMGQVLGTIYQAVNATVAAVLLVIFSPLLLLSSIFNGAVIEIELVPLWQVFLDVPTQPRAIFS